MKSSKRRTLKIKTEQCAHCLYNDVKRKDKGLDPCVSPTEIEIRDGKCLAYEYY
jgi:hypothetical protein